MPPKLKLKWYLKLKKHCCGQCTRPMPLAIIGCCFNAVSCNASYLSRIVKLIRIIIRYRCRLSCCRHISRLLQRRIRSWPITIRLSSSGGLDVLFLRRRSLQPQTGAVWRWSQELRRITVYCIALPKNMHTFQSRFTVHEPQLWNNGVFVTYFGGGFHIGYSKKNGISCFLASTFWYWCLTSLNIR